ncbi:hypothetical protein EAF04_007690 [Stromatinia cepivora]|nr:hypothetical protein EAF04_007690 [Stromatinia cepivora]
MLFAKINVFKFAILFGFCIYCKKPNHFKIEYKEKQINDTKYNTNADIRYNPYTNHFPSDYITIPPPPPYIRVPEYIIPPLSLYTRTKICSCLLYISQLHYYIIFPLYPLVLYKISI